MELLRGERGIEEGGSEGVLCDGVAISVGIWNFE